MEIKDYKYKIIITIKLKFQILLYIHKAVGKGQEETSDFSREN